jgi:TonB-linked SusC/RagA family outer membrane protein
MKKYILIYVFLVCATIVYAQEKRKISGSVTAADDGTALAGVNVIVKGTTSGTSTDANGKFTLEVSDNQVIIVSFIGYRQVELPVNGQSEVAIQLIEDIATLGEITIVSTGYQQVPKERVNGSFVQVDNQLLNRRVGTDVLSRMEDVTSGLIFNRNIAGKKNDISIRGMSTISSQSQPLIVIDNFPYDGDINNINPNDVESITVLKDAAAASIWGARAGNGVIVITTKKGSSNQAPKISVNSNITIAQRPDLFYESRMSSSQMIENEQRLFNKGYYTTAETSYSSPLTPAVELMIANRDGLLSDADLNAKLTTLGNQDIRKDYEAFLYRKSVNQQYAVNLTGGSAVNRYYLSAGMDRNLDNLQGNQYTRVTLNLNNSWTALKDRLTINAGVYYSQNNTQTDNEGIPSITYTATNAMYPYARLKDDHGNNLSLTKDHRLSFIQQAQNNGLLNWQYSPLDEIRATDNQDKLTDYRINASINYRLLEGLNAEVLYQYWQGNNERRVLHKDNSYFARNLVNSYSSIDADGMVTTPIPAGGILDLRHLNSQSNSLRGQLNYNKVYGNHEVNALAGYERREINTAGSTARNYGYNDELATTQRVNYTGYFSKYDNPFSGGTIPYIDAQESLTDRYVSFYGNAGYTFKKRYSISGSARRDQSNLFGVRTNQKSVPLWSSGIGWTISEEDFYKSSLLPYLKLRLTYGANGNINKQTAAYTTAYSLGYDEITGLPYSVIQNPGNPNLKWEKVNIINSGLDFESKNRRIYGSVEYYRKAGKDLIGTRPFAPSSGVDTFTGNFSSTQVNGVDLVLNSLNVDQQVKWNTTLLFSFVKEKVTDYETETPVYSLLQNGPGTAGFFAPLKGKPLYAVYSYAWGGLDHETGNPQGYTDGVLNTDYNSIISTTTQQKLIYHGPARPTAFGSVRNTIAWKNIALSFNISYRLGYYFRGRSVLYNQVLNGYVSHGDYGNRWQQPGDEQHTHVPSLPETVDNNRETFYTYSEVLVQKGDHVRLQDVSLNYTLDNALLRRLPFSRIEVYSYINNIGVIWKAASGNIDPDYPTIKPSRSIAFGARFIF